MHTLTILLRPKLTIAVSVAVLAIMGALTTLAVNLTADDQTAYESRLFELGATVGQEVTKGTLTDIALYVNGQPVSTLALYKQQAESKNFLDVMLTNQELAVPDDEYIRPPLSPKQQAALERGEIVSWDTFDGVSPLPESSVAPMRPKVALVQEYGSDTMALALIIENYALYGMALEAGHEATDAQVAEAILEYRSMFNAGIEGKSRRSALQRLRDGARNSCLSPKRLDSLKSKGISPRSEQTDTGMRFCPPRKSSISQSPTCSAHPRKAPFRSRKGRPYATGSGLRPSKTCALSLRGSLP